MRAGGSGIPGASRPQLTPVRLGKNPGSAKETGRARNARVQRSCMQALPWRISPTSQMVLRFGISLTQASPIPGQSKDQQTFQGGAGEGPGPAGAWICVSSPLSTSDSRHPERCLEQTSDHKGHPGWKVVLEKSRKNPA